MRLLRPLRCNENLESSRHTNTRTNIYIYSKEEVDEELYDKLNYP